jgi:hypothetical protein
MKNESGNKRLYKCLRETKFQIFQHRCLEKAKKMKPACHGVICRADEAGSRLSLHVPSGTLHLFRHLLSGICIKIVPCPAFCGPNGPNGPNGLKKAKLPILSLGVIYGNSGLGPDECIIASVANNGSNAALMKDR